jgi:hypothetical protein
MLFSENVLSVASRMRWVGRVVEAPGGVENASRKVPGPPFLEKRGIKAVDFVPYP